MMIEEQKIVLDELERVRSGRSIQCLSDEIGIERTRLFRILKGQEMRVSEYYKFKKYLQINFKDDLLETSENISLNFKKELNHVIERAKLTKKLLQGNGIQQLISF